MDGANHSVKAILVLCGQVSVAVLLDNFLSASKEIQQEENSEEYISRKKVVPVS